MLIHKALAAWKCAKVLPSKSQSGSNSRSPLLLSQVPHKGRDCGFSLRRADTQAKFTSSGQESEKRVDDQRQIIPSPFLRHTKRVNMPPKKTVQRKEENISLGPQIRDGTLPKFPETPERSKLEQVELLANRRGVELA